MIARHCFPDLFENVFPIGNLSEACMAETDEAIFVKVPIPGCSEEKTQITYEQDTLFIKAEEQEVPEEEQVKQQLKSSRYTHSRKYAYEIPISARIDEQTPPKAVYKNGMLYIALPKSRANRPIKISVAK